MKPEIIKSVSAMSARAIGWNFSDKIALVPTMGFLHEGHLALVREAAKHAETVIVSIFVNPLQFGPSEDFARYPRDLERDAQRLSEVGADIIFAPTSTEMTPEGMTFKVDPGHMASVLCGKYRPGHFEGVCTIVTKLFQIVRPGLAVFGWKDAQQLLLLRKMADDLNIPVQLHAVETLREADNLAMSSRNIYLDKTQRKAAPAIFRALQEVQIAYHQGQSDTNILKEIFHRMVKGESSLTVQYAETVSMDTLMPIDTVLENKTLFAVAVYAGETRLIDNVRL